MTLAQLRDELIDYLARVPDAEDDAVAIFTANGIETVSGLEHRYDAMPDEVRIGLVVEDEN
jgi:hypothetical protein